MCLKVGSEHSSTSSFRAADLLGVRFHATRGSMSRGKSDGGLPPDDLVQDVDTILRDSQRLVEKFHDTSRFSMHQVALAPCSPFSVTTDLLKQSAVLARSMGVRLHTHLCETKDEERFTLEAVGMRPLAYMESCGWLGEDVWYAHGIHFNDQELRLLAQTGTGIAHCPVSNMKLASGVCRVPDMLALGVPVGLAVDGSASNDCSNLLTEIRAAYLLHRLTYSAKAPTGYDLLKMATMGSARLLGRQDEIGSLEVGKAADLFLLNVDLLELAGAKLDPACLLGTVGYARPAELVMVNGRVVVEHGRVLGMDEERTRARAEQLVKDMLQKRNQKLVRRAVPGCRLYVFNQGHGVGGHAGAVAGEAQVLLGGGLDVDAAGADVQGGGHVFLHLPAVGADLRGLGDEGGVDIHHPVSGAGQGIADPGQQHQAGDVQKGVVAVRKQAADVSQGGGPSSASMTAWVSTSASE